MVDRNEPILLVEDHPDDEFLTLHVLRKNGLSNVRVARDAEAAAKLLFATERDVQLPQFIFLDLRMPKMDGFDLLELIRRHEHTAGIPVVVLSSSEQPKDKERCAALRVSAYVNKPLVGEKLAQVLKALGESPLVRHS